MQVWLPWAAVVYGEAQHQLLMAVLLENAAEASAFAQRPPSVIGQKLSPLPPQQGRLGVDRSVRRLSCCNPCGASCKKKVQQLSHGDAAQLQRLLLIPRLALPR